jgi:hypothetical protein
MLTFRTSSANLWHLGVDLSVLRCKKCFRGEGAPYGSYTVYRRILLEIEKPVLHNPFWRNLKELNIENQYKEVLSHGDFVLITARFLEKSVLFPK